MNGFVFLLNWIKRNQGHIHMICLIAGDYYLKPFVIAKPQVRVVSRSHADEFLIVASDGLWDVVSNDVACQVVRKCLQGQIKRSNILHVPMLQDHHHFHTHTQFGDSLISKSGTGAAQAAAVLAELAMARGSRDNISVTVVELNSSVSAQSQHSLS